MRYSPIFLLAALLGGGQDASAFHLALNGLVSVHNTAQPMAAARVRIYKDGVMEKLLWTNTAGQYALVLENHADYVVRVDAPGYQVKCITIDTHGLEWEGDHRLSELEVEMRLMKKQDGTDLSYFDLPLGMAYFEPATGLTRWNVTYENTVNTEVRAIMYQYDQRCAEAGLSIPEGDGELGALLLHRVP